MQGAGKIKTKKPGEARGILPNRKFGMDTATPGSVQYYAPQILSATDYYAFGSPLPGRYEAVRDTGYRFGFNGKEKVDEVYGDGNSYDFGARIYDARVGRWWSVDPLQVKYPNLSPYQFSLNNPVFYKDPNGKSGVGSIYQITTQEDADKYGVEIGKSIVLIQSNFIFYGSITKGGADAIVSNLQYAWNNVDNKGYGSTEIDGVTYQVVFEFTAEVRTIATDQSESEFLTQYASEFFGGNDYFNGQLENGFGGLSQDIKNNFVRIACYSGSSETRPCNSGRWATDEMNTSTALNEIYHMLTGKVDVPYLSGQPRAANPRSENMNFDPNSRIVTQDDIDDIGLGTLLVVV